MTVLRWVTELLGLKKLTPYEKDYIYETNIHTGTYMAAVVMVLEIWMIIRNGFKYQIESFFAYFDRCNSYLILLSAGIVIFIFSLLHSYGKKVPQARVPMVFSVALFLTNVLMVVRYLIQHLPEQPALPDLLFKTKYYLLLAVLEILFIVYCVCYLQGKHLNHRYGQWLMVFFSVICIGFGIETSMYDLSKSRQILCFLTMILYVACLLIWNPLVSMIILAVAFYYFYGLWSQTISAEAADSFGGDAINFFIFWISLTMVSISMYHQRKKEAAKDERLEEANEQMHKLAVYDELTGLYNMTYFRMEANAYIQDRKSEGEKSFLFLDVENFKAYNEKYGFNKGNELLKELAELIRNAFPESIVARFSDDHFAVLTDLPMEKIEKIVVELHDKISKEHRYTRLGIKLGVYRSDNPDIDPAVACDYARYACSSIKKQYDKNICIYDAKMEKDFRQRQYVINSIDEAVEKGYIKVFYQPVVWAADGTLCGCEALARWDDPVYGLLPPGAFIPVLEEYHQIHKVDICILEQVCRNLKADMDAGKPIVPISVNFSRLDFEAEDVNARLEEMTEKYGISKKLLHVEITESALGMDSGELKKAVHNLWEDDYELWLDDFGSAYSSLNVLKDYEFNTLKIDLLFLRDFAKDGKATPILKSIVAMAKVLGMSTVAEGVETREAADFLNEIGCERLQGYFFGKPMPAEELQEKIASGEYTVSPKT
ncbi:MAG: EAL domain-containing protein [Lachnospiraceae bacterium]|nr:EAL domain-containing protein [Lachnospiraceae bacterium]